MVDGGRCRCNMCGRGYSHSLTADADFKGPMYRVSMLTWNQILLWASKQRFCFERYTALVRGFGPVQAGPSKFKPTQ
jgi:hypothetical protein